MALIIEEKTAVQAWLHAIKYLQQNKGVARNMVLEIEDPVHLTPSDKSALEHVDGALRTHSDLSINTVAATIFPQAMYARYGRPDFYSEFQNRMKRAQAKGTWGTYALRMMSRMARDSKSSPINPLEQIVEKLRFATTQGKPFKSVYELGVFEPSVDLDDGCQPLCELPLFDASRDGRKVSNMPCLSHLTFKLHSRERVDLTAIYRSHYYCERALGNLIGLSQLLNFVCKETKLKAGYLTCISTHAVLDIGAWGNAADADATFKKLF
jgi:hypothetical protein